MSRSTRIVLGVFAGLLFVAIASFLVLVFVAAPRLEALLPKRPVAVGRVPVLTFRLPHDYVKSDVPSSSLRTTRSRTNGALTFLAHSLLGNITNESLVRKKTAGSHFMIMVVALDMPSWSRNLVQSSIGNATSKICRSGGTTKTETIRRDDGQTVTIARTDCLKPTLMRSMALAVFQNSENTTMVNAMSTSSDFDMSALRDIVKTVRVQMLPARPEAPTRTAVHVRNPMDEKESAKSRARLATFEVPPNYFIANALDSGPSVTVMIRPVDEQRFFSIALQSAPPEDAAGDVNDVAAWSLSSHRRLCNSHPVDEGVRSVRAKSQTVAIHYLRCTIGDATTEFGLAAFRGNKGAVTLEATGDPVSFDRGALHALVASIR